MTEQLKILFISAEVAPFAKRGGLGDVAGSLPKALRALGHDVRIVMPAYQNIERGYPNVEASNLILQVPVRNNSAQAGVFTGHLPDSDVPVYFIAEWHLFNRDNIYGYDDDAYRFAFFSRAAMQLPHALDWYPTIIHAHDWHTAPAVFWLKTRGQQDEKLRDIKTVFTIHNLAHQGKADWDLVDYLGIQTHRLWEEDFGRINLMARGIYHSDSITTVSPTYMREITTPDGGAGLDGLLRHRQAALTGILNGIDDTRWNPATDTRLPHHFDKNSIEKRLTLRHALQAEVGLPQQDNIPLIAMISRLDWQKGLDLMGEIVERLMNRRAGEVQFVLLGSGQPEYEAMFRNMQAKYSDHCRAVLAYNANLAPLIYAGSDLFLMPSLFEPCGLSQLLSMRYGSIPVVRATGGLVDTVEDGVSGFVFHDFSVEAFWNALTRAIDIYHNDKKQWQQIQKTGMSRDFSWENSARLYEALYNRL